MTFNEFTNIYIVGTTYDPFYEKDHGKLSDILNHLETIWE